MSDNNKIIHKGDIENVLMALAEYKSSAKLVLADYLNEKRLFSEGIITAKAFGEYERHIAGRINRLPGDPNDFEDLIVDEKASVFLSYNHEDMEVALRIQEELTKYKIRVRMDMSDVLAGQPIKDFIQKQIALNTAVVLLISKNSLTSAWVSYETTLSLFDAFLNQKRVIPVCLDKQFTHNNFSAYAFREIDAKLKAVLEAIKEHNEKGWGDAHLQDEKQRLQDAKHNLDKIINEFRRLAVFSIVNSDLPVYLKKIAHQILEK
jgi:TIR domain